MVDQNMFRRGAFSTRAKAGGAISGVLGLALIPLVLLYRSGRGVISMALFCIPMIISSYWMGKTIEKLRIEENTATPYRSIVANLQDRGAKTRLFLGSGLLIAVWPISLSIFAADWLGIGLMFASTVAISLLGARLCGNLPKKSFRVYGVSLVCIALTGIAVLYFRKFTWPDGPSNHSLWFMGALQAIAIPQVILTIVVWKRAFGKPK